MSDRALEGVREERDSVGRGAVTAVAFHLLQLVVVFVTPLAYQSELGVAGLMIALSAWGATHFVYLGPLAWWFRRKGQNQCMKGVVIVAAVGVLLKGGCDALVFLNYLAR